MLSSRLFSSFAMLGQVKALHWQANSAASDMRAKTEKRVMVVRRKQFLFGRCLRWWRRQKKHTGLENEFCAYILMLSRMTERSLPADRGAPRYCHSCCFFYSLLLREIRQRD